MAANSTTVFLVRHAKAADRETWDGADRDRPLIERGRLQADPLGLEVQPDDRLGYDRADLAGFVSAAAAAHPGRSVVAVSHGDLIPLYLGAAGLLDGYPQFRTGSLFRLDLRDGRPQRATLIDRRDLKG